MTLLAMTRDKEGSATFVPICGMSQLTAQKMEEVMSLKTIFKLLWIRIEEFVEFQAEPFWVFGITDEKGYVHLVQAPAVKFLKSNMPEEINIRWVYKDFRGKLVGSGDPERRRVIRRDFGIIPLFYFVSRTTNTNNGAH